MPSPSPSAYQVLSPSASPLPERSPLESTAHYHTRLLKWKRDNAWRAGQMEALEKVGKKEISTLQNIEPGKNPR